MHNRFVEDYDPTIEGTARVLTSANLATGTNVALSRHLHGARLCSLCVTGR